MSGSPEKLLLEETEERLERKEEPPRGGETEGIQIKHGLELIMYQYPFDYDKCTTPTRERPREPQGNPGAGCVGTLNILTTFLPI